MGAPNVGKSTLLNHFVAYPLSIATHKPNTTRQNIIGIHNEKNLQIIYVDTPGYLKPTSELQVAMMRQVERALLESDLFLWVVDIRQPDIHGSLQALYKKKPSALLILLNKIDLLTAPQIEATLQKWHTALPKAQIIPISLRHQAGLLFVQKQIKERLPVHPPYYPKETFTDKSERFFIADLIRKYILLYYHQEIPYSTQITIAHFKETPRLLRLDATLYVERASQKSILIGKKGSALKKVGTAARQELSRLYKKKVFLTQHVKVSPQWRNERKQLTAWGYL